MSAQWAVPLINIALTLSEMSEVTLRACHWSIEPLGKRMFVPVTFRPP